ncbi:MAG: hypothetical protein ACI4MO_05850 [Christensenellales bacterium]
MKTKQYTSVLDTDLDKPNWTCDENDLLCDIKRFMQEYYVGFFTADGKGLVVKFNNGQSFHVLVKEIK